jgi:hypothetical protein
MQIYQCGEKIMILIKITPYAVLPAKLFSLLREIKKAVHLPPFQITR